jgi:probable HAF family extracellular repeat protein
MTFGNRCPSEARQLEDALMTALRATLLVALIVGAPSPAAVAAPVYTVEDLGLPPGTNEAQGNAVNADGTVVGQAKPIGGFFQAVLWPSGTGAPTSLAGVIGESTSVANGLNDAGNLTTVAGFAVPGESAGGTAHFWNGATLFDIGALGTGTPATTLRSVGNAVNNANQVVGRAWASDADTGYFHAFSWRNGTLTDLGTLAPCQESDALDINENGQIVGSGSSGCLPNLALIWPSAGAAPMSINGILASAGVTANVTLATGINDGGVVLAQRTASGKGRCVLVTPGPPPALVDIGTIGVDAQFTTNCSPGKINDRDEVVATQRGGDSIALLYAGGVLYDLNALLEPGAAAAWQLLSANDINDSGTIVGQGRINGELHAYRAIRICSGPSTCTGDCDLSGAVRVDELVTMVTIALGSRPVSACPAGDANCDQRITVDEVIGGVGNGLGSCGP